MITPPLATGDSIVLLPGEFIDSLVISPIQDNIVEGMEYVTISACTLNDCGDTVYTEGKIWIDDEPHSIVLPTNITIACGSDSISLGVTTQDDTHFVPFSYSWTNIGTQNTQNGDSIFGKAYGRDTVFQYLVTSTDACGFHYSDTATIILHQTLNIDSLKQYIATCGENDGAVVGFGYGYTGTPNYIWTGSGTDSTADSTNASAWSNLYVGWYYFSIKDNVCKMYDSILVEQIPPPEASFEANPASGMSPLNVTFVNTSDPAFTYA